MNHDMYLLHWYLEPKTNIFMMGTFLNDYLFIFTTVTGGLSTFYMNSSFVYIEQYYF
jgi:hypothetical protein